MDKKYRIHKGMLNFVYLLLYILYASTLPMEKSGIDRLNYSHSANYAG